MNDQPKPDGIIAKAISEAYPNDNSGQADPRPSDPKFMSSEECAYLTTAILNGLDQAGFKIVPK